jgi:hypothetical protein
MTTANASLAYYTLNWLWVKKPIKVADYFTGLFKLSQCVPNPRVCASLEPYLERAWDEGRDPSTGLFDRGGIGSPDNNGPHGPGYCRGDTIGCLNQAAFLIKHSLWASPRESCTRIGAER